MPSTTVTILKSDGTTPAASGAYSFTLASGTTYYAHFAGEGALVRSAHVLFDSAIVITSVEIEDSNFSEVTNFSAVAGEWVKENPATSYVATSGAGTTATLAVVAKTAGAIGAAMYHLGNTSAIRTRLKIVVGAAGGVCRIAAHGER